MRLCYVGSLGSVHTERWIRYFAGRDHEVHVLTPVPASHHAPSTVHIHLVKQIRTGRRQIDLPINALLGIPQIMWYRAMLRRINPDLVHAHYLNDAVFFASLAGARPFVSTAWGSDVLINPERSRALRWMVRLILRRSDLITCDARHLREAPIRLGADPARVRIVYCGTDTDTFTTDRRDPVVRERLGLRDGPVVSRIRFTRELSDGLLDSDVVFIAVGTPSQDDGQADLSAIISVAEELVEHWNQPKSAISNLETSIGHGRYRVIAVKSTVPVGAVELVRSILSRDRRESVDFDIVSNPEFLREGKGLYDFFHPDRIVGGACSDGAFRTMRNLYAPIISGELGVGPNKPNEPNEPNAPAPVVETDFASFQMIKYASNAFLATRVSFINNETALLCPHRACGGALAIGGRP